MPSTNRRVLPPIAGSPAYDAFLDRLAAAARADGHEIVGRTDLVELALKGLAADLGLDAPRRVHGMGREPRRPAAD
jgi:hypothetical protein